MIENLHNRINLVMRISSYEIASDSHELVIYQLITAINPHFSIRLKSPLSMYL